MMHALEPATSHDQDLHEPRSAHIARQRPRCSFALLRAPVVSEVYLLTGGGRASCAAAAAVCGLRPQLWERLFLVVVSLPAPALACLQDCLALADLADEVA